MSNVVGRGVHATAIQWPGFSTDPWSQDLLDFFAPLNQNQIINQVIRASYNVDHYDSEVETPNGWAPLPDGAYLVKLVPNQGGALYAYDADTFAKCWKVVV